MLDLRVYGSRAEFWAAETGLAARPSDRVIEAGAIHLGKLALSRGYQQINAQYSTHSTNLSRFLQSPDSVRKLPKKPSSQLMVSRAGAYDTTSETGRLISSAVDARQQTPIKGPAQKSRWRSERRCDVQQRAAYIPRDAIEVIVDYYITSVGGTTLHDWKERDTP
jgi:hypothetical protein